MLHFYEKWSMKGYKHKRNKSHKHKYIHMHIHTYNLMYCFNDSGSLCMMLCLDFLA
jgi:hypothetical protein